MTGMRVALVGDPAGWHVRDLGAALAARGATVDVVRWSALGARIEERTESFMPEPVAAAAAVVVRGMPGAAGADRLEEVVFRMDVLGRLAARGTPVVNPPRALEIAIDKYLALARLAAAGLPVPRTIVAQDDADVARAIADLGGQCVVKPLFGSRGRGVERITGMDDPAAATAPGHVRYLQEFVPHPGWDARILVVGERCLAMRRVAAAGDWRTNVSRGGRPEPFDPPAGWIDLARRAAAAVGAPLAGVDLLPASDGRVLVLEVNAVPGWRGLRNVAPHDPAATVAEYLLAVARSPAGPAR